VQKGDVELLFRVAEWRSERKLQRERVFEDAEMLGGS